MNNYLEYAKHIGGDEYLMKWVSTVLKNELAREVKTTEEVEHILDFLVQYKKKIQRMSYKDAKRLSDTWLKAQIKKGNNIVELPEDTEVVLDFNDGFKVVKLIGENAYKREGLIMSHCVASYYGRDVEIYSLRDKDNTPHCTMEKNQQIKGKGNGDIHPKYISYVVKFLEHVGMTVGDSEMKHLGYMNVEKFKNELHKDTKYFNYKYIPTTQKLINVDGNDYFSPELLNIIPPLEYRENKLTINFDLKTVCKLSFEWIQKKSGIFKKSNSTQGDSAHSSTQGDSAHSSTQGDSAHSSTQGDSAHSSTQGDSAHSSTQGNYAHSSTQGNYAHSSTQGNYAHSSTQGDSAHSSTQGYSAHSSTQGYSAHSSTQGNYAHSSTQGNYAHSSTQGNYAHSSTQGNYAHSSTQGNYAHSSTQGYYAHSSTQGNYAHSSTQGDSAHSSTTGKNSIACGLGIRNKAQANLGEWIVLSEWYRCEKNYTWNIKQVKTVKVDGVKIKANTLYQLTNGKFVEAK